MSEPAAVPTPLDPDLVRRLERLGVSLGAPAAGAGGSVSSTQARHPARAPLEEVLPGRALENGRGTYYVSDARHSAQDEHAGTRLGAVLEVAQDSLAEFADEPRLADVDLRGLAVLDTETTGLLGSAGTYAFLIGVGRFEGPSFVVRQLFMRHPGEEAAQLEAAAEWLADCTSIASFNGRAYDVPLLQTRYTYHGVPCPLGRQPHVDVLPLARRLWRRRLDGCALQDLEREILGTRRQDDVPGWLVPERYMRYQRDGDARPLSGIFHHNVLDVLTTACLVPRIADLYARPHARVEHPVDWLSLAAAYERAGDSERAVAALDSALAGRLSTADEAEAKWRRALVAKRQGDWERAVALWRELLAPRPWRLEPFVEIAKYFEHQRRDFGAAMDVTREARRWVEAGVLERYRHRAALAELDHRLERLERRRPTD